MDNQEKDLKYFAIVIGDWHFNSLGLVRSLGEKGILVVFINLSDGGYAENSRYTAKTFHAKNRDEVLKCVLEAKEEFGGYPVLFPGSDIAAVYVDSFYNELKNYCLCPGFCGRISQYMDKDYMCICAQKSGFIVPETQVLTNDKNSEEIIKNFPVPFIIKPRKSVDGNKSDIKICKSQEEIGAIVEWLKRSDYKEVLIQKFVNGKNNLMVEYCGCKKRGKKVQVFGRLEKIREYPSERGSTSFATIKKDLKYIEEDTLDSFLESIGFDGIFDLEIKVTDNIPFFLEINFRNGAPSYAFTKAGFNVPYMWFVQTIGKDFQTTYLKEIKLMSERDDLNHVIDKKIFIGKWLRDLKNTDVFMIYDTDDLSPFENSYSRKISKLFKLIIKNNKV